MNDDDLHFRFDEDKVKKLRTLLWFASDYLEGTEYFSEEYEFCEQILIVLEEYLGERKKCV